ncbi:MAG: tyrosine-type recombinase/integrase [Planctomycetaceae bacterium]|nr:tyrosine-type recombinase/integrase [Planctomycetaceae bacterium]
MARPRKKRRRSHGTAWHWKQTDCWYYTLPGTKQRVPLFDEQGGRIRGKENSRLADHAFARARIANQVAQNGQPLAEEWSVARVCSEYLQSCERRVKAGAMSTSHNAGARAFLNDLCGYCGALKVTELKRSHIQCWIESHTGWKSPSTHRSAVAFVQAAFNYAETMFDVASPLKGLKRPKSEPRLQSFSPEDETTLLGATEERFRNFLFAAIRTGLRPYCELAKLTADHVEVTPRGMLWRVCSSKTKKSRKIPVRSEVANLVQKLLPSCPKGSNKPIFRNTKDEPWQRMTGVVRFLAIKKKLGWDQDPVKSKYSSYTCRHTFAHRMLSGYWNGGRGCSIETLAELIGDTPKVAFDHYGKEWGQHYQDPLWAAIGVEKIAAKQAATKRALAKRQPSGRKRKAK